MRKMRILFLHGLESKPGCEKVQLLQSLGHIVQSPRIEYKDDKSYENLYKLTKHNNYDVIIDNLHLSADSREKEFFLENLSPYKIKLLRKLFPKIAKYYYTDNSKRYNFLVEQDIKLLYKDTITLKGRYDLKYSLGNDNCVVDYKTSTYLPSRKTVLSGEYLQLPFYTLLDTNITSAEYLSINVSTNSIKSDAYSSNDFEDARNIILNTVENIYAHIVNKTTLNVEKNLSGCDICGFSDTNRN